VHTSSALPCAFCAHPSTEVFCFAIATSCNSGFALAILPAMVWYPFGSAMPNFQPAVPTVFLLRFPCALHNTIFAADAPHRSCNTPFGNVQRIDAESFRNQQHLSAANTSQLPRSLAFPYA
jgi:hypothetical protein